MIEYTTGDMFSSPAQTLVIPTNTVGVMGAGVALEAKIRWPRIAEDYYRMCRQGHVQIGTLACYNADEDNRLVVLFPTKIHWRDGSKVEYIQIGLRNFAALWKIMGVESAAFPALGCGLGGLQWDTVRPWFDFYLGELPFPIHVYATPKLTETGDLNYEKR